MRRRRVFLATAAAGALSLAGRAPARDRETIGISMPTKLSTRWISDGNRLVKALTDRDYKADLQYADNDVPSQLAQIDRMIAANVKMLVISAIDGTSLSAQLKRAADSGIKVIAYDRLIRGSMNVDYYTSFDNLQVGVLQASAIVEKLGLRYRPGPCTIELFGGSPDDNNAYFFYDGAMSILKPYLESGKLVLRSRQMGMDRIGTLRWEGVAAKARMHELLRTYYRDTRVDAVLSPYDGLSIGILAALKEAGYGAPAKPYPIVTGQDAEIASVKSILRGEQSTTVFKDTRLLAKITADMIDAIVSGKQPLINNYDTYDNGLKIVPSCLLEPVSVDITNWRAVLIDSGYYAESQIQ